MESKLSDKLSKHRDCQDKKLQLEEKLQRLRPQLRDMKNTLEKYVSSMTVRRSRLFKAAHHPRVVFRSAKGLLGAAVDFMRQFDQISLLSLRAGSELSRPSLASLVSRASLTRRLSSNSS